MTQKKVVCLLADGFEDSEYAQPVAALRKRGFAVEVVGSQKGAKLTGKSAEQHAEVACAIGDASVNDYIGMLIPGGKSPAVLAKDARFSDFVREFNSSGKPIAAICHGPAAAAGRRPAQGPQAHRVWRPARGAAQRWGTGARRGLVSDGNWITSRTPADLPQFCEALALQFEINANQSWMARGDVHVTP